jgi:hypothetical protein
VSLDVISDSICQRSDIFLVGIGPIAIKKRWRHLGVPESDRQHDDSLVLDSSRRRPGKLLLTPFRAMGSGRDDREKKITLGDRLGDPLDNGVADAKLVLIDPDTYISLRERRRKLMGELIVRVGVAEKD